MSVHQALPARAGHSPGSFPVPAFLVLALGQLMLVLDVTVVNVAMPAIGGGLRLSPGALPWVITSYTLAYGGLMLLGGRIADRAGARRALLAGMAVFTAASAACGIAGSGAVLLASRAVQGAGAALLSPAALSLATASAEGRTRQHVLGAWAAISGFGSVAGVVLGGVLTSAAGWRWVFSINVPVGLLVLAAVPFLVKAPVPARRDGSRLDVPGAALVTAGTGAVLYGLINAGSHGWTAPATIAPITAGLAGWAALTRVERRSPSPLLDLSLFRRPVVAAGAGLILVATALLLGGSFLASLLLQRHFGYSAIHAGLLFLPAGAATIIGAQAAAHLLPVAGTRRVALAALLAIAAGDALPAFLDGPTAVVAGLSMAALGAGASFVTGFGTALAEAGTADGGVRSAIANTAHELGGAVGIAVLASIAGAGLAVPGASAAGPHHAFGAAAALALAGAGAAARLMPAVKPAAGMGHGHS